MHVTTMQLGLKETSPWNRESASACGSFCLHKPGSSAVPSALSQLHLTHEVHSGPKYRLASWCLWLSQLSSSEFICIIPVLRTLNGSALHFELSQIGRGHLELVSLGVCFGARFSSGPLSCGHWHGSCGIKPGHGAPACCGGTFSWGKCGPAALEDKWVRHHMPQSLNSTWLTSTWNSRVSLQRTPWTCGDPAIVFTYREPCGTSWGNPRRFKVVLGALILPGMIWN